MNVKINANAVLRSDARLKTASISLEDFSILAKDKLIYIFSVNLEGMGLANRFQYLGFNVAGFVDSRYENSAYGFSVVKPDDFYQFSDVSNIILIVATKDRVWKSQAFERSEALGYLRGKNLFSPLDLCPYFPTIEIAGRCNLICKTCDMGLPGANKGRGHMSKEMFKDILIKLTQEIPFLNSVALYTWGEPLMNKDIADIVKIAKSMGVATEVSTNLDFHKYLDDFVLAEPAQIVAPCAGIGEKYERGRTGGKWENYLKGLHRVSELKKKHNLNISLRIMYHVYNDNFDEDYDQILALAEELGYTVIPIVAHLFPGQVLNYAVNKIPVPSVMMDAEKHLVFGLDDQLAFARTKIDKPCHILQAFPTISWDGKVLHCCNMQQPFVGARYLDAPLDNFIQLRDESSFCTNCMNAGVHRFFDVNIKVEETEDGRKVVRF